MISQWASSSESTGKAWQPARYGGDGSVEAEMIDARPHLEAFRWPSNRGRRQVWIFVPMQLLRLIPRASHQSSASSWLEKGISNTTTQ